jgi:hypothetical protein
LAFGSNVLYIYQGLPGDGRDRAGARKCPQNDPWGVVRSMAPVKKKIK